MYAHYGPIVKFFEDPSRLGQMCSFIRIWFFWVAMVMIGHDCSGMWGRLGEFYVQFTSVWPLWTCAEHFVKIHQELAKLWRLIRICFNRVGRVLKGHEHLGLVRLLEVGDRLNSVCPLWTYAENFKKIHKDLAKIWRFISICFNGVAMVMIGYNYLG